MFPSNPGNVPPSEPAGLIGDIVQSISDSPTLLNMETLFTSSSYPDLANLTGQAADTPVITNYPVYDTGTVFMDAAGYITDYDWFYTLYRTVSAGAIELRFSKAAGFPADATGTTWTALETLGLNGDSTSVQLKWSLSSRPDDATYKCFYCPDGGSSASFTCAIATTDDGATWDSSTLQTSLTNAGQRGTDNSINAGGWSNPAVSDSFWLVGQNSSNDFTVFRSTVAYDSTSFSDLALDLVAFLPDIASATRGLMVHDGYVAGDFEVALITDAGSMLLGTLGSTVLETFANVKGTADSTIWKQSGDTNEIYVSGANGTWYSPDNGASWSLISDLNSMGLFYNDQGNPVGFLSGDFYNLSPTAVTFSGSDPSFTFKRTLGQNGNPSSEFHATATTTAVADFNTLDEDSANSYTPKTTSTSPPYSKVKAL